MATESFTHPKSVRNMLDQLKVLDFTWGLAGPLVTKYLADYEATVVRIESPLRPCGTRVSPPFKDGIPGVDRAGYFAFFNANKYSLSLDLNHAEAMSIVEKLVRWADVVVESYSPGTMERWGLGYQALKTIRPDVVMLRTSSQGQDGPHSTFSAFGIPLTGLAGFSHLTGWPDRDCLPLPSAYSDLISPRFAAAALLAVLDHRRRTGEGQCIDCSQLEASLHFLAPVILDCTFNGREAQRMGNSHPAACPHGTYRCRGDDRWCAIGVFNDEQWHSLCRLCDPQWRVDPRFRTLLRRKKHEVELDRALEEWTVKQTPEDIVARMQKSGIPAGVVQNAADLYEDPQLKGEGFFWFMDHPILGRYPYLAQPSRLSRSPASGRRSSPCLGQDTEHVCTQILGMPDTEFLELYQTGVFY